jgi:3-hydroxy-3-methylglutaryl CoA synthase/uncharacterized OB-fold protein
VSGRAGIVAYGAYVPWNRLDRAEIAAFLGGKAIGKGYRSVAAFDEDSTSMGVEAARRALAGSASELASLWFATTAPPYADKTNASILHAALGVDPTCLAVDLAGSVRNGVGALRAAFAEARSGDGARSMAVLSDLRTGLPSSSDERDGGDGAASFLFGTGDVVVAEVVAWASATEEFLDRWRRPGDAASRTWEERFAAGRYPRLMGGVAEQALRAAEVTQADHVVITSPHLRSARSVCRGFPKEALAIDLGAEVGYTGAADVGLGLVDVLDRAGPGESVLVVSGADGADAIVLRTTEALPEYRAIRCGPSVRDQIASRGDIGYGAFLSWRGMLTRDPPRRPDLQAPSAPAAARVTAWKFALTGSRCQACKTMHLPPQQVCMICGVMDRMTPEGMDRQPATIATFAVDHLGFSPAPPIVAAVVDFEGGGRLQCEMADASPTAVRVGDPVEMTFRRLYSAGGIHNYFWKARPVRGGSASNGQ